MQWSRSKYRSTERMLSIMLAMESKEKKIEGSRKGPTAGGGGDEYRS